MRDNSGGRCKGRSHEAECFVFPRLRGKKIMVVFLAHLKEKSFENEATGVNSFCFCLFVCLFVCWGGG